MKTLPLFLCALAFACGGATDDGSKDIPGQPPSPPDANDATPATTTTTTFAIDAVFLGDDSRDGAPSTTVWKSFGYDLDRLATTKDSTNVCTLANGAPKANQLDGNDGIDNAWGSIIVPLMQAAMSTPGPSAAASFALSKGAPTLELAVTGMPTDPSASVLGLKMVASFGDASSRFDGAYASRGTFVSGAGDTPLAFAVPFIVNGLPLALALSIHDAVVTFASVDGETIRGTIAGVLDVGEFSASASAFATRVNPSYFTANPTAIQGILGQITQAADILIDGTNAPGVPCSAISIGIGFTAHAAH